MKKLNKLKWLPFVISLFLLASCSPKPPDVPVCEFLPQRLAYDLVNGHLLLSPSPTCMKQIGESECAHCVFIVSGNEFFLGEGKDHQLNGKPWSKVRAESVYLPAKESYAPLAAYLIDSCKKMHCSEDLEKFKVKLDSLNGITGALANP